MSKSINIIFLIHAIVSVCFGLWLFLAPGSYATIVNWTPYDPTITRVFGAFLLALAMSSWLGFRAKTYASVRILVQMEIAITVLAAVAGLYQVLMAEAPAFSWVCIGLFVAFAIAWIAAYAQAEKQVAIEPERPEQVMS